METIEMTEAETEAYDAGSEAWGVVRRDLLRRAADLARHTGRNVEIVTDDGIVWEVVYASEVRLISDLEDGDE